MNIFIDLLEYVGLFVFIIFIFLNRFSFLLDKLTKISVKKA